MYGNRITGPQAVGLLIALMVLGAFVYFFFFVEAALEEILLIMSGNWAFWAMLAVATGIGLIQKIRHPDKFLWIEIPIQLLATSSVIFVIFPIFYATSTDLIDTETWSGYITEAEYFEEWTEEEEYECDCDSEGNNCSTCTREIYHPPEWYTNTSNGEHVSIASGIYRNYVAHFGNEKKENLIHMNQVSIGDGDRYYVTFKGNADKLIPSARPHKFSNYLKASHSIRKGQGVKERYAKFLRPYPQVYSGHFGPIETDRVVNAGSKAPKDWIQRVDRKLDIDLSSSGKQKQVNVVIYIVATSDQMFFHALEEHWVNGKKNDVVVVIGSTVFPKIDWVSVMAWTNSEMFKIQLRDKITNLKTIENGEGLVQIITSQIRQPESKGGFERMKMKELEYLASDITLPWWANLIILLVSIGVTLLTSWALINNDIQAIGIRFGRRRF